MNLRSRTPNTATNSSQAAPLLVSSSSSGTSLQERGCGHFTTSPRTLGKVFKTAAEGGYEIGYEIHGQERGKPVIKILAIMGFMNSMGGWERVMDHFINRDQDYDYQFLVFDNRGIGQSTQGSFARMTTSGLAKDALAVLKDAGWTEERSVHLMGISMGGMISLELASMAWSRFKSLTLLVTGARWRPPRNNLFVGISVVKNAGGSVEDKVRSIMSIIFSDEEYLAAPCDASRYPLFAGKTNREQIHASLKRRMETLKKPSLATFLGQLFALVTHSVSNQRLKVIGEKIPDMLAVGAKADKIVDPELSKEIAQASGCKLIMYEGKGHVITTEAEPMLLPEIKRIWLAGEQKW